MDREPFIFLLALLFPREGIETASISGVSSKHFVFNRGRSRSSRVRQAFFLADFLAGAFLADFLAVATGSSAFATGFAAFFLPVA